MTEAAVASCSGKGGRQLALAGVEARSCEHVSDDRSPPLIISPTEADPAERPIRSMQTLVDCPDWLHGKMMYTRSRNEFPDKADNKQAVNDYATSSRQ